MTKTITALVFFALSACGGTPTLQTYCVSTCDRAALCLLQRDGIQPFAGGLDLCARNCVEAGQLRERVDGPQDWIAATEAVDSLTCEELLGNLGV